MSAEIDNRTKLINIMSQLSNPNSRQDILAQLPKQVQSIFSSHDERFKVIGQDGTQALIDWQNNILHGHPMSKNSVDILNNLYTKLTTTAV